jgi:hypothetical protein
VVNPKTLEITDTGSSKYKQYFSKARDRIRAIGLRSAKPWHCCDGSRETFLMEYFPSTAPREEVVAKAIGSKGESFNNDQGAFLKLLRIHDPARSTGSAAAATIRDRLITTTHSRGSSRSRASRTESSTGSSGTSAI